MSRKAIIHIISWLLFSTFIFLSQRGNYLYLPFGKFALLQILLLLQIGIIFYINYLIITPRFIIKQRQMLRFFGAVFLLLIFGLLLSIGIRSFHSWNTEEGADLAKILKSASSGTITIIIFIVFSTGIRLIEQYNEYRLNQAILKEAVKKAELEAIKAKINPHFLHNAFNTLYALAEMKSDKISEAILQLSFIMRYLLNNSSALQISILEELKFIRSYIDFQKLRVDQADSKIITRISDPEADFLVSPTILLSFVENAFKHSNLLQADQKINIEFEPFEAGFRYLVSNHIAKEKMPKSGLGNKNLKKILELTYPGKYELDIWIKDDIYHAKLYLNLDS